MNTIQLKLNEQKRGGFVIDAGDEKLAEMQVAIIDKNLVVYHTEVADKLKGQGIAPKLLTEMVEYARRNKLMVVPLCAYVSVQFKRHPDEYADIWNHSWHP